MDGADEDLEGLESKEWYMIAGDAELRMKILRVPRFKQDRSAEDE